MLGEIARLHFFLLLLVVGANVASSAPHANDCTTGKACQPYNSNKPCTKGERLDLRLGLAQSTGGSLAFGFCPIVDEVQAFNISGFGDLINGVSSTVNVSIFAYGQGKAINPTDTKTSTNSLVFAALAGKQCPSDEIAVADFLLLRIPTTRGAYTYLSNESFPDEAGFTPTCDTSDRCLYSSGKVCIGEANRRNCATCYGKKDLSNVETVVWTSYHGTDSNGRNMVSGSSSPSEFRKFSMGSLDAMIQAAIK